MAASAWVACEWLRSTTVFTGFGWNGLGVAFHRNVVLMQVARIAGAFELEVDSGIHECPLAQGTARSDAQVDTPLVL